MYTTELSTTKIIAAQKTFEQDLRCDLVDIVTTLQTRGVGVQSLCNGLVDTTTAHGALVFGMFALMAEYEAALIRERTHAGLAAARARGRKGGRTPKMTPALITRAQRMYDSRQFTMAEIAATCSVTPNTVYRHIRTDPSTTDTKAADQQRN